MLTYQERHMLSVQMFDAQREVAKAVKANRKALELAGVTPILTALAKWDKASALVSAAAKADNEGDWAAFMALEGFPEG